MVFQPFPPPYFSLFGSPIRRLVPPDGRPGCCRFKCTGNQWFFSLFGLLISAFSALRFVGWSGRMVGKVAVGLNAQEINGFSAFSASLFQPFGSPIFGLFQRCAGCILKWPAASRQPLGSKDYTFPLSCPASLRLGWWAGSGSEGDLGGLQDFAFFDHFGGVLVAC